MSDQTSLLHPEWTNQTAGTQTTQSKLSNETGGAGLENLVRSRSHLLKNCAASDWLHNSEKLTDRIIKRFYLGIAEPFYLPDGRICSDALCAPVIAADGNPRKRRVYQNIPGITTSPKRNNLWSWGAPLIYYSCSVQNKRNIFICSDLWDLWHIVQAVDENEVFDDFVFVSSTDENLIPEEMKETVFWTQFREIYFGHTSDENGELVARTLKKICFSEVKRVIPPMSKPSWSKFFNDGGAIAEFLDLIETAEQMSTNVANEKTPTLNAHLGEFAIEPVNCNGAYVVGNMYYPYRVERREIEKTRHRDGSITEEVVTSYQTKVVRSDGVILDIDYLPAPRGTPASERVLALSDGTRIDQIPKPNSYASWQIDSITDFISSVRAKDNSAHRPFGVIINDLLEHFRRSLWLPFDEDYTLLALYTALSFVYNVFEAIPLLLVFGPKGSGKSDLGAAIEAVAFNSVIIGDGTAASAVRILNESRGLVVWDDLEQIATKINHDAFSDVHQMLKLSYKKKTSKKAITGRNGQTTMFDFYGPKVVNNTRGVDSILGSRMLIVQTKKISADVRRTWCLDGSDPEYTTRLRNELHAWGMINAAFVEQCYRTILPKMRGSRKDEIITPLKVLAELTNDPRLLEQLDKARLFEEIKSTEKIEPIDLLAKALGECIRNGFTEEIALPHIQLQIAVLVDSNQNLMIATEALFWLQHQWIGNSLESGGFKEKKSLVRRARLYGKETRIYRLRQEFVRKVLRDNEENAAISTIRSGNSPFEFCTALRCSDCIFVTVCEKTVPGLMKSKNKRFNQYI